MKYGILWGMYLGVIVTYTGDPIQYVCRRRIWRNLGGGTRWDGTWTAPIPNRVTDTKRNAINETILFRKKSSLHGYIMTCTPEIDNIGTKYKRIHLIWQADGGALMEHLSWTKYCLLRTYYEIIASNNILLFHICSVIVTRDLYHGKIENDISCTMPRGTKRYKFAITDILSRTRRQL